MCSIDEDVAFEMVAEIAVLVVHNAGRVPLFGDRSPEILRIKPALFAVAAVGAVVIF
jgi:hypothetical protein